MLGNSPDPSCRLGQAGHALQPVSSWSLRLFTIYDMYTELVPTVELGRHSRSAPEDLGCQFQAELWRPATLMIFA